MTVICSLAFRPHEVAVNKDSINIELRMNEGAQARINNITVEGNTKTNDHVILRELHTLPGQKFSRANLIRTNRDLATLGYFNPEKIGINPVPNPQDGTVDINYSLEEKPSDQVELPVVGVVRSALSELWAFLSTIFRSGGLPNSGNGRLYLLVMGNGFRSGFRPMASNFKPIRLLLQNPGLEEKGQIT